ncbi:MAG: hypothetical protein M3R69_02860 [Acidobacteriota bacterium]|nr:hypothetical protein [Acidobacteriota bacterium]
MKEKSPPRKPTTKKEIILAVAAFGLFTVIAWRVVSFLMTASWRSIIGYGVVMVIIVTSGVLSARFKSVDKFINKIFSAYFRFAWWVFLAFIPILAFYWLSPIILNNLKLWAQMIVFAVWLVLLAGGSLAVLTEKNRERFLPWLQSMIGRFAPIAYAFNLLIIAVLFFSSVTYVFVDHGRLNLKGPTAQKISPEALRDFYSWHFLDAVPGLKVNETVRFKEPLSYESTSVGLLLLLFKLIVIVPVVAAFGWYWKHVSKPATKT